MRTADLIGQGFGGGIPFGELKQRQAELPPEPGVYAVATPGAFRPEFLAVGSGGFFKGKNPNVPIARLQANWVAGTDVLYFGKAGGHGLRSSLRGRLSQYHDFGNGAAHYGGRLIWQLRDAMDLLVYWMVTCEEPRYVERELLTGFRAAFGALPFANLRM